MRSRIKVAVSGAVVAFVATATLLSGGAQADTGDAVTAGQVTTADYVTYVKNTGVQCPAVFLGKAGLAACGDEAVYGYGTDTGINGIGANFGVNAQSLGQGGTGVYGYGTYGVHGQSGTGWGVWGEGPDRGVYGVSDNEGVVGFSNNVGIRAESPNIALRVKGKAEFSRSGTVTISYPNKQATVTGRPGHGQEPGLRDAAAVSGGTVRPGGRPQPRRGQQLVHHLPEQGPRVEFHPQERGRGVAGHREALASVSDVAAAGDPRRRRLRVRPVSEFAPSVCSIRAASLRQRPIASEG
jgi:hypothetical protein